MIRLTKIYTRTGDKGETSLGDGSRVSKENHRVEAYGTIDEANSIIGLVRTKTKQAELILLDNILATIQNELFDLGAEMSIPMTENNKEIIEKTKISEKQIERLENEIDQLNVSLSDLESFVLPGGTIASSYLHLARTVIRKAERLMVKMDNLEENSIDFYASIRSLYLQDRENKIKNNQRGNIDVIYEDDEDWEEIENK